LNTSFSASPFNRLMPLERRILRRGGDLSQDLVVLADQIRTVACDTASATAAVTAPKVAVPDTSTEVEEPAGGVGIGTCRGDRLRSSIVGRGKKPPSRWR